MDNTLPFAPLPRGVRCVKHEGKHQITNNKNQRNLKFEISNHFGTGLAFVF
jgi:hypothetical protein